MIKIMDKCFLKKSIQLYLLLVIICSVRLTSSASFYGSSFISMPLQESKSSTSISFRFKTYQLDAMLFLAAGPIDYCLITLESGQISVRVNLGSGEAVLTSKDLKLNDLVWHRVDIQRTDAEISLTIDGLHTSFFDIPGKFFELNIRFGLYVGGLGNFNELYLGTLQSYRGCIDQLFYNGIDVIDSSSKSNGVNEITYDCSNEFEATHFDAISFAMSGSYVVLPGFASSARNGGTLHFDIKTSSSTAVLFYNYGSVGHQSDFISVEIINGRILLSVNDGNGIVVLQSDVFISDGFFHHIEIQFSTVYLEVSVDGKSRNLRPSLGDNKFFDLNEQLFVGGIELNKQSIAYQHGLQSILSEGPDSSLKGCLKGIKMGQRLIGLRDAQITKGIKSGECVWEFQCLIYDNSPCIEGAECFQEGFNEFRCLCDSSVCVRPNFTSHYILFNTKQDNEAFIDVEILKLEPLNIAEGGSDLITNNFINVVLDYHKYGISENGVLFHIKESPKHGILEIEVWDRTPSSHYTNIPGITDNVFSLQDLITEKVRYTHDGSENYNDSIIFELEFESRFYHLPAFIHGKRHSFTFFIKIHPINDAPKIISNINSVLKLAINTKRLITSDILHAEDDDNSPEEIRYSIVSIINGDQSFIENIKSIDIPIESFTQNDINKKLIRFVHKTRISNMKNDIKVLLTIFDKNDETAETTLFIETYDLELISVNNTGIALPHNSFGYISATNLSFVTNSESDLSQFIRFEMIKQSQYGNIQKLRGNGHWANVSFFSQRQINRNKIRYVHFKEKPSDDILELQVSYNEIKSPLIHFRITFKASQLRLISLNQLSINQEMKEIPITNKELKFDTQPFPTPTDLIIYTILSLPTFGSLQLLIGNTTNKLSIGSFVTQKMIDEEMLIYNCSASVYPPAHDSFDFEVATEGGLTNVEVSSFHFKFIRSTTDFFILTNEKLIVIEGDKATINSKLLRVETPNKLGSIIYNITNKPKYGTIKLLNQQLNDVMQTSSDQITQTEIDQNRVVYYHDDSENSADVFDFVAFDSQNNFICFGTFTITVIMKNDNPPIRVVDKTFHVVIHGEKKLTSNDLKYVDADIDSSAAHIKYSKTYIPNGNLYFMDRPNVIADQFTQEDLDKENILFKHNGDETGRAILWITDGQFYASGVLEIKASKPYLRISQNTGLQVKYGESSLFTINNLTVESNMDISRKSDVTIKITSEPKFGLILMADKETNRFTLQDLADENVEYESKILDEELSVVQEDSFMFRIFLNGEDYLSSRVTAENQVFNISIYPQSYFQLSIINLKNISTDEDKYALIDSSKLLVSHPTLEPENLLYMITQLPKYGVLSLLTYNTTPTPMHFPSKNSFNKSIIRNETLLLFTQKDINDGLIHYKYLQSDNDLKNLSHIDCFKFDVTNGITTLRDLTVYINIISKIITLFTGNLTVTEGHSVVLILEDFVVSNAFYANLIDEYLVIEEPKYGSIVYTDKKDNKRLVKSFSPKQIKDGQISYDHDGSETTRDWLTIVVRANSLNKESLPSTIHVMIEPINDETPHVVNNTGLELWEGTSSVITNSHLAAVDDDSIIDEIVYQISTPSNGYVTTIDNRQTHIERFTQEHIDLGVIIYVHSGEMAGGFRFQVTDGTNFDSPHVFTVTAKSVVISVVVNEKLYVFPGMQQSVTRDHLLVETNDGNYTRDFIYHIIKEPKYGRFLLENSDGSTKSVLSFSQKQINQNFVLYEQNKPINDVLVQDEIWIDIESRYVQSLKGVKFIVEIAIGNFANDLTNEIIKMVSINPLTVIEGHFSPISEENLNISLLIKNLQKKQYNTRFIDKLYLKISQNPIHGVVLYEGHDVSTKTKSVPLSALTKKSLVYKHDNSNSFNDTILFGLYIRNGIDIMLLNQSFDVTVIPVNDEIPILLTQSPILSVIQGSKILVSNSILKTRDDDGLPQNVVYEFILDVNNNSLGYFMVEPSEEPVNTFNQLEIDSKKVYFKHKGNVIQQRIKFRIKDENSICPFLNHNESQSDSIHCTPLYNLTVVAHQLTLKLYNHSTIQLLQGSIKAKILPKHLGTISNDLKADDIIYSIREGPIDGYIIVNDRTNNERFTQKDINSFLVSYIQINKSSTDYFIVDILRNNNDHFEKSINNVTVSIAVKPLVKAKKPFLISSPGQKAYITQEYLDASELSSMTNSVPKFLVTSNPKYGYLKKFSHDKKQKNRSKRKSNSNKSLIEFTHEDILKSRIAYIADNDIDLSYPKEIMTDVVHYELSAHNVQSAFGVLVINIVSHKLIATTNYWDIRSNKTRDLDNDHIEMYHENSEINYLNIIITRDHLLIAFVFLVVVILTVALIVIIRFCHSSGTHTRTHSDKSGPITATLNASPAILETPPASDYGGDILMLSSRLSPRSTPSASEMETGMIPVAPPTSPSLSTNCSIIDVRSHSGTPRGFMRSTVLDQLRGGCAASEDLPQEPTTSNIFPLPPPSLYFGTESVNISPTNWGSSSIPMCKVPPIYPRCLEDHYCATYHHSIYPFGHNTNTEMSPRVLGDGTSLVSSPVPSLRKTPWSAEDLYSASTSSNNFVDTNSLHYRNRMQYNNNNNCKFPNTDVYIDDNFSNDCMGLQSNLGQTSPKQKQQYWV